MSTAGSAVRGVLFDIDGTLVASNDAHARAWLDAFHEAGYHPSFAEIRDQIGMGGDKIIPDVTGMSPDEPRAKALAERNGAIFKERYLPTVRPFSGVRPLLERMRDDGLVLVVATSAKQDEVAALLDIAGARDLFDATASHADAKDSKPDPDIIEAAVRRSGLPAHRLVMIGDTPYDVEAATRANVRCIAFRSGGWADYRLRGAVAIYDGPSDLLDHYADFKRTFE